MGFVKSEGICPLCKRHAVISRKWVRNGYRKRYDYTLYHHDGAVHYLNGSRDHTRIFKKGELKKLLMNTINSENFKSGLFTTEDARRALIREYPDVIVDSIRDNLHQLVETGMLESVRKGRSVFFLNSAYKERLSFVDDSKKVILNDLDGDFMYRGHVSEGVIRNDKDWPLYYLLYRIFGDTDIRYEELKFRAYDETNREELKIMILEDNPREKRLLLKLAKPLFPNETMSVRFEYVWEEPKQVFFFTTSTHLKNFEFRFNGNAPMKLQVTQTVSTLNEMKDLSNLMTFGRRKKWRFVYSLKLKDVRAFSVIQFKWKRA